MTPSDGAGPLAGLTVVALEQAVAAPLCTRHLADLGARVIKVERPGGDFARGYDSVVLGMSAYFVWLNHGKESVALELSQADDRSAFEALLDEADVFVHNLGPGAVDRLGYDWPSVHARWPGLIDCMISGFGSDGPYRSRKAFDLLLQAESGLLSVTGPESEPARVGISIADISAGMYALSSVLACLYERRERHDGRFIDIAMLDSLAEWMAVPIYYELYAGAAPAPGGAPPQHHRTVRSVCDGGRREASSSRSRTTGSGDGSASRCSSDRPSPTTPASRRTRTGSTNRAALDEILGTVFGRMSKAAMAHTLERADIPFASLNEVRDLVDHPQLAARGRWTEAESSAGPVRTLVPPFNIAGFVPRPGRVPDLPR